MLTQGHFLRPRWVTRSKESFVLTQGNFLRSRWVTRSERKFCVDTGSFFETTVGNEIERVLPVLTQGHLNELAHGG